MIKYCKNVYEKNGDIFLVLFKIQVRFLINYFLKVSSIDHWHLVCLHMVSLLSILPNLVEFNDYLNKYIMESSRFV